MDNKTKQAMQMALEALEGVGEQTFFQDGWDGVNKLNAAITALREALAQPQGEWVDLTDDEISLMASSDCPDDWSDRAALGDWDDAYKAGVKAAIALFKGKQVFCEYCGGNDETPQDHCMDCERPLAQPQGEPVAELFLGGLDDSGEYGDWEVDPWARDIEALQEKLVTGHEPVRLMLYTTPPSVEAAIEATKAKYEKKFDEVFGELIEKINGGMSAAAAIRSMK